MFRRKWEEPAKSLVTREELDPNTGKTYVYTTELNLPLAPITTNPAGASAAALNPADVDVKMESIDEDAMGIAEETMAPSSGDAGASDY